MNRICSNRRVITGSGIGCFVLSLLIGGIALAQQSSRLPMTGERYFNTRELLAIPFAGKLIDLETLHQKGIRTLRCFVQRTSGDLARIDSMERSIEIQYDTAGRMMEWLEVVYGKSSSDTIRSVFVYDVDDDGRVVQRVSHTASGMGASSETVGFDYGGNGKLVAIEIHRGRNSDVSIEFEYDANDHLALVDERHDLMDEHSGEYKTITRVDSFGKVIRVEYTGTRTLWLFWRRTFFAMAVDYLYDAEGRIGYVDVDGDPFGGDVDDCYAYRPDNLQIVIRHIPSIYNTPATLTVPECTELSTQVQSRWGKTIIDLDTNGLPLRIQGELLSTRFEYEFR